MSLLEEFPEAPAASRDQIFHDPFYAPNVNALVDNRTSGLGRDEGSTDVLLSIAFGLISMKKVSYYLFLSCLVFAPLAFGTVEQWSLATLEVFTAASFSVYFVHLWLHRDESVKIIGLVPLLLMLGLVLIQLVPMPAAIVKTISPGTYEIYSPVLGAMETDSWIPLSVNRKETLHELLRYSSYVLVYILTIQLLHIPAKLKFTVNVVVYLAAAIALLAIIQSVSSPDRIYWLRTVPVNARPFGPWVNPNQFAGYIELLSPLAVGLFLFYKPRARSKESLREKVVLFFTVPAIHLHLFLGFAAVLMVLAVFVSLCRGGILTLLAAAVVFLFLFNRKFPKSSRGTILLLICCSFAAISWFGWDTVWAEFNQSFDNTGKFTGSRLILWSDSLEIIKTFPVVGAGFGSFLSIYPLFKTIKGDLIYDHAHNDYLELLTSGGLIGFALSAWFVLAVLWHGWKMILIRRDQYAILVGIGSATGIIAVLVHSLTDFNLQNGAIGYYFFFLCGVLISSVNCRFAYFSHDSLLKRQSARCNVWLAIGGCFIIILTVAVQVGSFNGQYHYNATRNIYLNEHLAKEKLRKVADQMQRSIASDPFEGFYSYKLGTVQYFQNEKEEAFRNYISAGMKNPLEGIYIQQLGFHSDQGRQLIEEGYRRALFKDRLVLIYAEWLLLSGRRGEAIDLLRSHLGKDYRQISKWMVMLNGHGITREEFVSMLPDSVEAWLVFGRYCELNRTLEEADFFYSRALTFRSDEFPVNPDWFKLVIGFFQRHGQREKALKFIRQAVETVPNDAIFHIMLGDYYQREGITYRAKEEYERALILAPRNGAARSKLRQMGYGDSY